jgi:hypothetical protein
MESGRGDPVQITGDGRAGSGLEQPVGCHSFNPSSPILDVGSEETVSQESQGVELLLSLADLSTPPGGLDVDCDAIQLKNDGIAENVTNVMQLTTPLGSGPSSAGKDVHDSCAVPYAPAGLDGSIRNRSSIQSTRSVDDLLGTESTPDIKIRKIRSFSRKKPGNAHETIRLGASGKFSHITQSANALAAEPTSISAIEAQAVQMCAPHTSRSVDDLLGSDFTPVIKMRKVQSFSRRSHKQPN